MKTPTVTPAVMPSATPAVTMPAQGRVGIGQRIDPFHAELHAANSARLSAMDKAKDMAGAAMQAATPRKAKQVVPPC